MIRLIHQPNNNPPSNVTPPSTTANSTLSAAITTAVTALMTTTVAAIAPFVGSNVQMCGYNAKSMTEPPGLNANNVTVNGAAPAR